MGPEKERVFIGGFKATVTLKMSAIITVPRQVSGAFSAAFI